MHCSLMLKYTYTYIYLNTAFIMPERYHISLLGLAWWIHMSEKTTMWRHPQKKYSSVFHIEFKCTLSKVTVVHCPA